jgi:hypothetical protein
MQAGSAGSLHRQDRRRGHLKKLVADSGARNARVVKPGMEVTMDFRQDRVTVQVDGQNRIERASCG